MHGKIITFRFSILKVFGERGAGGGGVWGLGSLAYRVLGHFEIWGGDFTDLGLKGCVFWEGFVGLGSQVGFSA